MERIKKILRPFTRALYNAGGFVPLAQVDTQSGRLQGLYNSSDLSSFLNGFFKFAIALGAIVAVLRIAQAGYLYMGSDIWSNKSRAKEILNQVALGLLLLLAIYLILYQINPDIVKLNAIKNINALKGPPQTQTQGSPTTKAPADTTLNQPCPDGQVDFGGGCMNPIYGPTN